MEILVTVIIILLAAVIFYKNIKKSAKGQCNCGNCSSKCNKYKIKR
ncbi:FeoB-associated Cys-rich membrane protein [Clostridium sp. 19966]|nr:FeoB-associated Cys-rich membrane protein [Clostridium sp. 19966]MDT8716335.1 FeoB-associated Cys-rich membrane protein [Clostridium sp. 19966]